MKALILLVPLLVLVAVWLLVVRYRGGLPKPAAHVVGVLAGLVIGVLTLSLVLPEPTEADKAKMESDRIAEQAAQVRKDSEQQRREAAELEAAARQVPQAAMDRITLLYINKKIYADAPIDCDSKVIGVRSIVGCSALRVGGRSAAHLWLYENGKFKSLNGPARSLAETKFSNESDIEVSALPLPVDIDVESVFKLFSKS